MMFVGSQVRNMRGGKNEYLQSLLDPENVLGVKVPDLVSFPSCTFQTVYDTTIPTSVTGDGFSFLAPLWNGVSNFSSTTAPMYYAQNTTTGGAYGTPVPQYWNAGATMNNLYTQIRLVSAVLYAEFIGPTLTDGGQITMGILARGDTIPTTNSFYTYQSFPFSLTLPLKNGARVVYKPMDNLDLEYSALNTGSYSAGGSACTHPTMFIATAGLPININYMRIRTVANWEAIPSSDTITLVNASPGPVDLEKVAGAFNWMSSAYSNVSSFISNVSPFVSSAALNYGQQAIGRAMNQGLASAGGRLRLIN
jgi:hypothetical protein